MLQFLIFAYFLILLLSMYNEILNMLFAHSSQGTNIPSLFISSTILNETCDAPNSAFTIFQNRLEQLT